MVNPLIAADLLIGFFNNIEINFFCNIIKFDKKACFFKLKNCYFIFTFTAAT